MDVHLYRVFGYAAGGRATHDWIRDWIIRATTPEQAEQFMRANAGCRDVVECAVHPLSDDAAIVVRFL